MLTFHMSFNVMKRSERNRMRRLRRKLRLILVVIVAIVIFEVWANIMIDDSIRSIEMEDKVYSTVISNTSLDDAFKVYLLGKENEDGTSETGIIDKFINNGDIEFEKGIAFPWGASVTYKTNGYKYDEFVNYCTSNNVTDYSGMLDLFDRYLEDGARNYRIEIVVKYRIVDGKWVGEYEKSDFARNISFGIVDYYSK